jgi:hypothetical protein
MLIKGFGERRHASANCGNIRIVSFCCVVWCNLHFLQNIDTSYKGAGRRRVFFARLISVAVEGLGATSHSKESSRKRVTHGKHEIGKIGNNAVAAESTTRRLSI